MSAVIVASPRAWVRIALPVSAAIVCASSSPIAARSSAIFSSATPRSRDGLPAPLRERLGRGLHRTVDVLGRPARHAAERLAPGRVLDLDPVSAGRVDPLAADQHLVGQFQCDGHVAHLRDRRQAELRGAFVQLGDARVVGVGEAGLAGLDEALVGQIAQRQIEPDVLRGLDEQPEVLAHQLHREAGVARLGEQRHRQVVAEHEVARRAGAQRLRPAARARRPPSRRSRAPRRGRWRRSRSACCCRASSPGPAPTGPTCTTSEARCASTGRARSSASASPPTITTSVPFSAPMTPRLTGASRNPTPCSAACAASSRSTDGSPVLKSMISAPRLRARERARHRLAQDVGIGDAAEDEVGAVGGLGRRVRGRRVERHELGRPPSRQGRRPRRGNPR